MTRLPCSLATALALLLAACCWALPCQAEEMAFPQTEEEFVRSLQPSQNNLGKTRSLTRSLRGISGTAAAPPKAGALIHFDYDSARIKPESFALLDEFGRALQGGLSNAVITIAGHTDAKGSRTYNKELSLQRATAVQHYLMQRFAIPSDRLKVAGFGETRPIAGNNTAQGRARNRRVEFIRSGEAR